MNRFYTKKAIAKKLPLVSLLFFVVSLHTFAQAPSSFTYPTPVVYNANISGVFLSPNVSGNVTSYSMPASPALPAGLTFSTSTGIIQGVPTAAKAQTTYTITATNSSGSATTTLKMTVTTNYLNDNGAALSFVNTPYNANSPNAPSVSHPSGDGKAQGDITLYRNIVTISGQAVDCIVTTKRVTNVTNWLTVDQDNATDATNNSDGTYNSNDAKYFSPQISFGAASGSGQNTVPAGGSIAYDFQFIAAGTYDAVTKSGINIVLQNVKLNTYDIDGNNNAGSNQFNEFGGFSRSELSAGGNPLSSNTKLSATYNATSGLTKFRSGSSDNISLITDGRTRVQVEYANMSSFSIVVGAEGSGTAYFFLDFSAKSFTSIVTTSPSVDLDTDVASVGVNNEASGCGAVLSFTQSGQTNVASPSDLVELDVSYLLSNIKNGTGEKLLINGSGTTSIDLNFTSGGTSNVTVDGIAYIITKTSASGANKITFTRTSNATFTVAKAESLLDALKYSNVAEVPTGGDRKFTVNVLNSTFKSPDAVFTATVNCVSIAGHIWRDQNGLFGTSDVNTISANSNTGQLPANAAYAVLVNPATNKVISSQGIAAEGGFNFGTVSPGNYILYIANASQTAGTSFTAATYPSGGYVSVGENLGAGAGNDLLTDGKLTVTVGSVAITDANFGLNIAPVALDASSASQPNPGGTQKATVPTLNGTDPEEGTLSGSGNTVKITTLPGNAILYYDGVAVDLANPIITNYNPALLTVDPNNGALTVTFKYKEVDQAGFLSPEATVTMPFTEILISGKVYHDVDGKTNSLIDGTLTSSPDGSQLYANLVNPATGLVVGTYTVADGAYSFNTFSGLQTSTTFHVVISTTQGIVGTTTGVTPLLPMPWVNTADGSGTGDATPNGDLTVAVGVADITSGLDFGIELPPLANITTLSTQLNPGGTATVDVTSEFGFSDPDGVVSSIKITAFPNGITSIKVGSDTYTSGNWPAGGVTITVSSGILDKTVLIDPVDGTPTPVIPFTSTDNAGITSTTPGSVTVPFAAALVNISGNVWHDIDGDAVKNGTEKSVSGDNSDNNSGGSSVTGSSIYANLVNSSNQVVLSVQVGANGTFSFPNISPDQSYKVILTGLQNATGSALTTGGFPAGWVSTGTNTGGTAHVGDNTGIIDLGVVSTNSTDSDFGIEQPPVADITTVSTQPNPGGTATVDVTSNFGFSDPDGVVSSIKITAFPNDITSIKIGDDTYTSGTWPAGGVTITVTAGVLDKTVLIDPIDGTPTSVIPFTSTDNAGVTSTTPGSVTVPFTVALISVSGNVWHDINGNAIKDGVEKPVSGDNSDNNAGGSSVTGSAIYANLINSIDQVVLSVQVDKTGAFSFPNVPSGQSYKVILSGSLNSPGDGPVAAGFPNGWVSTGTNTGGTAQIGDNTGTISLGFVNVNRTGFDFGIEQPPVADSKNYAVSVGIFSTPPVGYTVLAGYLTIATNNSNLPSGALSGSDPEDCAGSGTCSTGKSFEINSLNADTKLFYDFGTSGGGIMQVTAGMTISDYDPSKLIIYGKEGVGSSLLSYEFTYSLIDAAGVKSAPVTYSITAAPLPVTLVSFDLSKENSSIQLRWATTEEVNSERFDVEHSADAKTWNAIGSVASYGDTKIRQTYSYTHTLPSEGLNYYRLKMIDRDATFAYSRIRSVEFGNSTTITLYPNPVTDKLTIQAKDWTSVTSIEMFNSAGIVVIKSTGTDLNNELNINNLPVGLYMLKLGSKNGTSSVHKIVVQK